MIRDRRSCLQVNKIYFIKGQYIGAHIHFPPNV